MKLVVLICVSLAVFAAADDLHVGKHEEGDVLMASRRIIAGQRRNGMEQPNYIIEQFRNIDGIITTVEGVNAAGSSALVNIQEGGPGKNYVVVGAFTGRHGTIDVQVDIFGIPSDSASKPPSTPSTSTGSPS